MNKYLKKTPGLKKLDLKKTAQRPLVLALVVLCLGFSGCQSSHVQSDDSLYQALGGQQGIERIVDGFIFEIGGNDEIFHHFERVSIDRFREKQIEHLCVLSGGPCEYRGDNMVNVHRGMNITEAEFNSTTNSLITAMDKAEVSIANRNRLLAIIAIMRNDVIYK